MPGVLQEFLASAAVKAAEDLATAFERLPEDKRNWSPAPTSRSALHQVAEVAILNGFVITNIQTHAWDDAHFGRYPTDHERLMGQPWEEVRALLMENTARVAETIRATTDEELGITIAMPWGSSTIQEICAYPYWNAIYHQGQINYIASELGCLP